MAATGYSAAPISRVDVEVFRIPTDGPESDGTLEWSETTLVVVHAHAAGRRGLGYTYADAATARLIRDLLVPRIAWHDAFDVPGCWLEMVRAIRNQGRPGIASMAISAVDNALWDLKARLLDVPLAKLLGAVRDGIPAYGSGGFTSYSVEKLQEQLGGWAARGLRMVKMKVGRDPGADLARATAAREAIGPRVELFVDANGAYTRKQALDLAEAFAPLGVIYFEEPVSSDDLEGLRLVRDRAPAGMAVAAGEYGYDAWTFRRMLEAGAVDILQADPTRCGGISGLLQAGALCEAFGLPLSAHCAPSISAPVLCAIPKAVHVEFFHDHVRIERMLFDGAPQPVEGELRPDLSRPGLGLELRRADAAPYAES